jgi:rSAM/selenodomain-associated transferase 1
MRHPRGRILIFAKAPVPGKVKTRLAATLGEGEAARLYTAMVRHAVATAVEVELSPVRLYVEDAGHPLFAELREQFEIPLREQTGADLGARMEAALREALEEADYAVLIGCDWPTVDAEYLERALRLLAEGAGVVLGPAEDGGYVLIGLRQPQPRLFAAIPWGTLEVLTVTRTRCHELGIEPQELQSRYDIDAEADLRRFRAASPERARQLFSRAGEFKDDTETGG